MQPVTGNFTGYQLTDYHITTLFVAVYFASQFHTYITEIHNTQISHNSD